MSIKCTVAIQDEGEWIVATCIENGIASQGHTIQESIANLEEAISLYYSDAVSIPDFYPVYLTTLEVAV